jgi:hypothetical protein
MILSSLAISVATVTMFLFLEETHGVLTYPRLASQLIREWNRREEQRADEKNEEWFVYVVCCVLNCVLLASDDFSSRESKLKSK